MAAKLADAATYSNPRVRRLIGELVEGAKLTQRRRRPEIRRGQAHD